MPEAVGRRVSPPSTASADRLLHYPEAGPAPRCRRWPITVVRIGKRHPRTILASHDREHCTDRYHHIEGSPAEAGAELHPFIAETESADRGGGDVEHDSSFTNMVARHPDLLPLRIDDDLRGQVVVGDPLVDRPQQIRAARRHPGYAGAHGRACPPPERRIVRVRDVIGIRAGDGYASRRYGGVCAGRGPPAGKGSGAARALPHGSRAGMDRSRITPGRCEARTPPRSGSA